MRGRALLFATSRYGDSQLAELRSPPVDVGELRVVLADPEIGAFQVETCVDVAGQAWRECLEEFFTEAARDDLLLVYVSGHGVKDRDGRLYFAATDTKLNKLMSTGVAASFIQEASARSRSRRVVMIFDTCFSGAFAKGYQLKSGGARVDSGQYFSEGGGKIVITASDDMQYAFAGDSVEGTPLPSVFTRHLIEGLRTGSADVNGDGTVTIDDLYRYVYDAVQRENPSQRPQQWAFGLSGDIEIASNPSPRPGKLPMQLIELLTHPNPVVRKAGVEEVARLLRSTSPPLVIAAREELRRLSEDDSRLVSRAASEALRGEPTAASIAPPQPGSSASQAQPSHGSAEKPVDVKPAKERKVHVPRHEGIGDDTQQPDAGAQRATRPSRAHEAISAGPRTRLWTRLLRGSGVIGAAALFALGLMALRWAMGFPYPSFFIPAVLLVTAGASGFATLIAPEAWPGTRTGRSVSRIGLLAVMGAAATAISGAVGAFGGYRLSVIELLVILGAGMVVSIGVISRRRVAADLPHPTP